MERQGTPRQEWGFGLATALLGGQAEPAHLRTVRHDPLFTVVLPAP
ncbi:hypothetical protein ABZ915_01360 [Streptomyces sp. NPDC046915]